MRICIFGAGAVGGHIAAKLARGGMEVSLVARGAHLKVIQEKGLTFRSNHESFTVKLPATDQPASLGKQDLVITTMKAHSLPGAVDGLVPLLGSDTPVVFAINGVPWWYFYGIDSSADEKASLKRLDPDGRLAREIGAERTIGCVIRSPNEMVEPGVIVCRNDKNALRIGEIDNSDSTRVREIAGAIDPFFTTTIGTDIRHDLWTKLMANASSSPVCCLANVSSRDLANDPELRNIYATITQECVSVAAKFAITLKPDVEAAWTHGRKVGHKPSMLQDLLAGRPLELDAQLLALQDLARISKTPTPMLDMMLALLVHRVRGG